MQRLVRLSVNLLALGQLIVGVLVLSGLQARAATPTGYDVNGISPVAGDNLTIAYAINNNGQVIGVSDLADLDDFIPNSGNSTKGAITSESGFLLTGSTLAVIPPLGTTSSGISAGVPTALNDSGQVVGESPNADASSTVDIAFIYNAGVVTNLGSIIGGATNNAVGVNNSGQIIGTFRQEPDSGPPTQSYLYNGTVQVLGKIGTTTESASAAYAINNSGTIVGTGVASGSTAEQGIIFNATSFQTIPLLSGATESAPLAINAAGNVAGWSGPIAPSGSTPVTTINLTQQNALAVLVGLSNGLIIGEPSEYEVGDAFYYNAATQKITDLGTLGGGFSAAFGLNSDGDVVGMSLTTAGNYNAFLYNGSVMVNLNTLLPADSGWTLLTANGINNAGDIVGFGDDNGTYEGFILTPSGTISGGGGNGPGNNGPSPVPLPSAIWSTLATLTLIAAIGRIKTTFTASH